MPTYKYSAVNNLGKKVKDKVNAESVSEATELIRGLDLFPVSIKEDKSATKKKGGKADDSPDAKAKEKSAFVIGGVSAKQLNTFTRQLSTLIDADIPIVRSLQILASQMKMCRLKKNLNVIVADIEDGCSLSDAMAKHKRAFSKIYVNTVKAGEIGGMLDEILRRLADFLEKMDKLKKKIIGSMVYPVSVVLIASGIITGIMLFIIPNFVRMFEDMEIDGGLPMITMIVVNISNLMVHKWYLLVGVPFGLFAIKKLLSKVRKIKYYMDLIAFKIPVFGQIINKAAISGFCRTLATLSAAGVPILQALTNAKDATNNEVLIKTVTDIYDSVREGGTIAGPLRKSKITDEIVINMFEVGEETGELDKMLVKIAENLDSEVDAVVDGMTALIEPVLIVFLGGAIGFIVIAMFMPMVKMMSELT